MKAGVKGLPLTLKHGHILVQKLRYPYRLYPHQKVALAKVFGCAVSTAHRFKTRHGALSIPLGRNGFRVGKNALRLTRVDSAPVVRSRALPSEPGSVTVIKDSAARCFASFVVAVEPPEPEVLPSFCEVGVDLGVASLAVTSDGEKIAPPKFLRSALKRPQRLQRSLGRKKKGSGNRQKAHATMCIEDMNVSGMLKSRRLARSMADGGWRMLRMLLGSKARFHGRVLKVVSRWEPISRTCSTCGHRDGKNKKELSIRQWQYPSCGTLDDQNVNAARTILAAGQEERLNACGAESRTRVLASGYEAGTHLNQEALCIT